MYGGKQTNSIHECVFVFIQPKLT